MNRLITITGVLLASIGLVACSSNTQKQNMTVGAVTGAVVGGVAGSFIGQGTGQIVAVGVGAIVGALIGGEVGKNMDHTDSMNTYKALNNNPQNKATSWKNTKTGVVYSIVPTSKTMAVGKYHHCRTYQATGMINGEQKVTTGTACRVSGGTWKTIS